MIKAFRVVLLTLVFISPIVCNAQAQQNDSLQQAQQDSSLEQQSDESINLLVIADSIQQADSLAENLLLEQINNLKARDASKKAELLARVDSLKKAQKLSAERVKAQVDSLRKSTKGVPVVLEKDTLFYIYAKLGPFTPSVRAESISKKLLKLCTDNTFDSANITLFKGEDSYDIIYQDLFILSITARDAFWLDKTPQAVAQAYQKNIVKSILDYKERNSLKQTLTRFGLLVLVLLIFFFGIKYLNKAFTVINRFLLLKSGKYINRVRIKNYDFLSQEQGENILRFLLKIFKWVSIAFLIYIALPIVFSIFPSTKGIAGELFGYILNPLKTFGLAIINFLPNLFAITVIFFISRFFIRFLKFLMGEIENGKLVITGFYPDWAKPTFNILRIIVYAFSFIIIFPYLPGSDSPVFQGVSVFLGLLISLGSSSAIANLIAGLVITYMRPFKIGDRVKIGETSGDVLEKTMLVTRIRTIKNEDVSIPNASILSGSTINYSSSSKNLGLILNSTVTIGYDVPWRDVHNILITAAKKTEFVAENPEPFVLQTSLDDFYVSYQVNAYTEFASISAKIYSNLHANIQDGFNEAGIEILSPHYRAGRDGSPMVIPPDYIKKKE